MLEKDSPDSVGRVRGVNYAPSMATDDNSKTDKPQLMKMHSALTSHRSSQCDSCTSSLTEESTSTNGGCGLDHEAQDKEDELKYLALLERRQLATEVAPDWKMDIRNNGKMFAIFDKAQ